MVRGGFRKCKPFVLSRCFFLQAVFVPGGAVCFVMGWGFPRGSCTRLCFWFGAVCVSASREAFCVVGFCKRYWFLAVRFVLSWGVFFPGAVVRSCVCCVGSIMRYCFLAVRFVLSSGGFSTGAVVRSCVCCAGRFS